MLICCGMHAHAWGMGRMGVECMHGAPQLADTEAPSRKPEHPSPHLGVVREPQSTADIGPVRLQFGDGILEGWG